MIGLIRKAILLNQSHLLIYEQAGYKNKTRTIAIPFTIFLGIGQVSLKTELIDCSFRSRHEFSYASRIHLGRQAEI